LNIHIDFKFFFVCLKHASSHVGVEGVKGVWVGTEVGVDVEP
jgi:hypothetical protein